MTFVKNVQIGTTHGQQHDYGDKVQQTLSEAAKKQEAKPSLEEEIYALRTKMEQVICNENSLTSKRVVKHSSDLDRKINEFMRQQRKIEQ